MAWSDTGGQKVKHALESRIERLVIGAREQPRVWMLNALLRSA